VGGVKLGGSSWLALLSSAAILFAAPECAESRERTLAFTDVDGGVRHAAFSTEGIAGHAFDIDLHSAELRMIGAGVAHRTVDGIAAGLGPHVLAVNASFFDEDGKAMGRVVDGGRASSMSRLPSWGALVVDRKRARIVMGASLPKGSPGGEVVVQGLPRLVVAGRVPKLKTATATRTAVCADGARITLVATTSRVEIAAFARFLALPRARGGIGCKDALNLDGGPSTQLHARLPKLELDVKGGWGVPNALVVLPRRS
jgi:hypothetical protein